MACSAVQWLDFAHFGTRLTGARRSETATKRKWQVMLATDLATSRRRFCHASRIAIGEAPCFFCAVTLAGWPDTG